MGRKVLHNPTDSPDVFSDRIEAVSPSSTVALSDRVKQKKAAGEDIVDLSVGEPDFPTPEPIIQAAKRALDEGKTTYGPSRGIPELRTAIAERHTKQKDTPCEPGNVIVTPAKHALLTFFLTILDPGDEVLIPSPAWVSYAPQVRLCGAKPIFLESDESGRIDPQNVQSSLTPNTRAIVLNSPSNPTGAVQPPSVVEALVDIAQDTDTWLLSDEVYTELTYNGTVAESPGAYQAPLENVAIVDGVSKAYAMTGWRIGWLIGPEPLMNQAVKVQQHSVTHPTLFAQYGALEAIRGDQSSVTRMRKAFETRRELVVNALQELGAVFPNPKGAFYAFPRFPSHESGERLAHDLLDEVGVAATPGEAFGPGGEGHVRLSYAASETDLKDALGRIRHVVQGG